MASYYLRNRERIDEHGWAETAKRPARLFASLLEEPASEVTYTDIQACIDEATKTRKATTVSKVAPYMLFIAQELRRLGLWTREDLADYSLVTWPTPGAPTGERHATLDADELWHFLESEHASLEMRAMAVLVYEVTSLRKGDVLSLTWGDLDAPRFERLTFGNQKLGKVGHRKVRLSDDERHAYIRELLRRWHAFQVALWGSAEGAEPVFPAARKGEERAFRRAQNTNLAARFRVEVAKSMGLRLGWADHGSYGKNSQGVSINERSSALAHNTLGLEAGTPLPPSHWPERWLELFQGPLRLTFHSSRVSVDSRSAAGEGLPERQLEAITQHKRAVSDRHYVDERKLQFDAGIPAQQSLLAGRVVRRKPEQAQT